ncbi:hypothetical protein HYPSUDRAFT_59024 [Hypholoma sublateritium FD-334 SS-4]|uniref:Uncharacterized protein n=1 Tax=Hypholoma sublateritium (strain FD-334 SS-4) TaxID=945553 RepID=A0A0D2P3E6_HYPSF|nr:hypothetical protein HYPSUDRAFT_59024 [Hypholoma sublateritium FD-334 SS-4]
MSDSRRTSSFSWEIPPFYEANDISPHPTLPILLAQTELIVQQPQELLATQEIGPRSSPLADRHQRARVRFTPNKARVGAPSVSREATPGRLTRGRDSSTAPPSRSGSAAPSEHEDWSSNRGGSAPPADRARTRGNSTSRAGSAAPPDRDQTRRDSDAYSDELIPKPEGEAGRPKRGGYNLQTALGWPTNEYLRFKLFIKKAVEDHLEPSKTFSDQSLESLYTVQALPSNVILVEGLHSLQAAETFPVLADYVDWWPATDFIRVELHYTRSRAKDKSKTEDAALGKKIRQQRTRKP